MDYHNDSLSEWENNSSLTTSSPDASEDIEYGYFNVTGGRDDNLIKLLATKLNFK